MGFIGAAEKAYNQARGLKQIDFALQDYAEVEGKKNELR